MPNDGSLPFSHGQSKVSYCHSIGGISLLDLRNPSRPLVGPDGLTQWRTFLTNHKPLTLLLQLDIKQIATPHFINPERVAEIAIYQYVFVPVAEACFCHCIPLCAVLGAYVVCGEDYRVFRYQTLSQLTDENLERLTSTFRRIADKKREPAHSCHAPSLSLKILTGQAVMLPHEESQR
jgi:hypothetical protein